MKIPTYIFLFYNKISKLFKCAKKMMNISLNILLYGLLSIKIPFYTMEKSLKMNGSSILPCISRAPIYNKLCLINTKREVVREVFFAHTKSSKFHTKNVLPVLSLSEIKHN